MEKFNSVKIQGRTNKWSEIDRQTRKGKTYYLFENDKYGDETDFVVARFLYGKWKEVCGTYDNLTIALNDEGL